MLDFKLKDIKPLVDASDYWRENGETTELYLTATRGKVAFSVTYDEDNHYAYLRTISNLDNAPNTEEPVCYVEWPSGKHTLRFPDTWQDNAPYEGRPYELYKWDCYTLVQDYMKREHNVNMESFKDDISKIKDNFSENSFVINNEMKNWDPVTIPQAGDGILFAVENEYTGTRNANHCGIYMGNNMMLHQFYNRVSCIEEMTPQWKNWVVAYMRFKNV